MIIPKGAIIASFVYEKSSNLDGYEETDKLTLEHVKSIDGYLGHEVSVSYTHLTLTTKRIV